MGDGCVAVGGDRVAVGGVCVALGGACVTDATQLASSVVRFLSRNSLVADALLI